MFDGFKARCNVSPETWLGCEHLMFKGEHNVRTGEVLRTKQRAEFNALKFELVPSTVSNAVHANLRGSLHRYHNAGGANADKYTFENVCATIDELQTNFGITPETSALENIEFGVNIETDRPAQWYINNLVAHKNLRFVELVFERVKVGKQCIKQQYRIKVYDKAKQAKQPTKNILRIEVQVNKMSALKPFGIATLADLRNRAKIAPLGAFLAGVVDSIVMFDTRANTDKMTRPEMKRFMQYQTANFWEDVGHKKRSEHIQAYKALCKKYTIESPAPELSKAVILEWNTLLNGGAFGATFEDNSTKNTGRFNQLSNPETAQKNGAFYPLEYTVNSPLWSIDKTQIVQMIKSMNMSKSKKSPFENIFCPKPPHVFKPKFCVSCGKQIFYQRKQSRFCSAKYVGEKSAKHCRNIASGKTRTFKARLVRAVDTGQFAVISMAGEAMILHPSEINEKKLLKRWRSITDIRLLPVKPAPV